MTNPIYNEICCEGNIPKNAYRLSNNTCACNGLFISWDEFKIYDDCHILMPVFFALYGISFFTYASLFTRSFFVAHCHCGNTFQSRRLMVYHYLLGVFSACAGIRILFGMAGYRYHQRQIFPAILEWFAFGSWMSSVLVVLSLWLSSFQTLRENSKIDLVNIVTGIMVVVTYCISFISQVLPIVRKQNFVNDYSATYYCSLILIALPLILLSLVTVLRICVWYLLSRIHAIRQDDINDLETLQYETKKIVVSMTVCDIFLVVCYTLIIIETDLLQLYGYLVFSFGATFVGATTYRESKFFDPNTNGITITSSLSPYPTDYSPQIPSQGWTTISTTTYESVKSLQGSIINTLYVSKSGTENQVFTSSTVSMMDLSHTNTDKYTPLLEQSFDGW